MKKNIICTNTIEVDDDIMGLLKENAEPFVDSPNMVLRRLLGIDQNIKITANDFPKFMVKAPKSLIQILEVIYLVKVEGFDRNQATNFTADKNSIFPQTVMDKYCRQLNMSTKEIDELLKDSHLRALRSKLKNKFSKCSDDIDKYFNEIEKKSHISSWSRVETQYGRDEN